MDFKHKSIRDSFLSSIEGLKHTLQIGRNIKIIIVSAIFVLMLSLILKVNYLEFCIIAIIVTIIFIFEVFNTLIEDLIDLNNKEYNPKIKAIKDISSSTVLIACITSVIIGGFIFIPKIINLFN